VTWAACVTWACHCLPACLNAMSHPLTCDQLKDKLWCFSRENGAVASDGLLFLPDGTVGGYQHKNEQYWHLEQGVLSFLNARRQPTVHFTQVAHLPDGLLRCQGVHLPDPSITLCLVERKERPRKNLTRLVFAKEIERQGWQIGDHTYGVPECIEKFQARLIIGKYCSIAGGVQIALGNHRTELATTYPFKALRKYWPGAPTEVKDHVSKGDVVIGSDVWIGSRAFIGSGVQVGHGAVIGAHAVVTKSVPAYAVVVGNPARVVRYRFDDHTVADLLKTAGWDLSDEQVNRLLPSLMSDDVAALLGRLAAAG